MSNPDNDKDINYNEAHSISTHNREVGVLFCDKTGGLLGDSNPVCPYDLFSIILGTI